MELGIEPLKSMLKAVGLGLLIFGLVFGIGFWAGHYKGESGLQPTINRLRTDSTKLATDIEAATAQGQVAQSFLETFDQNIQQLVDQRKRDREKTDSTLYAIAGMAPADAKRAILQYYANRQGRSQ